jgi:hypothetical protein
MNDLNSKWKRRQHYSRPQLINYGSIKNITQGSGVDCDDGEHGAPSCVG